MKASEASSRARPKCPAAAASSPAERFRLRGVTRPLDPRIHAVRRDVADVALAGYVFAPHYAEPLTLTCIAPSVPMRAAPSGDARAVSQLLHGEAFALVDRIGGWAWGYSRHDGYVGYVRDASVAKSNQNVSDGTAYRVSTSLAPVFSAPDIKSAVVGSWSIGVRFTARPAGNFLESPSGFIHVRHASSTIEEPATVAERLVGLPYLWGGRGAGGIDCSGLVQVALAAGGIAAPRDSDLQRALGREVAPHKPLRRGDLVFFPGHVGMMVDGARLLHATAHWMATVVEPLEDVVARLAATCEVPVLARRRID